ncbi:MAG: hypothetical protein IIZ94_03705 [Prevotella sp.]|nr:hypothetical protein [Prevotella sp.]
MNEGCGYIERGQNGRYGGKVNIEGVVLDGVVGVYFKKDGDSYLWLRREKVLEYDDKTMTYKEREARPQWEAYLKKQMDNDAVAYKGEFNFLRFRFSIVGVWDRILGNDKRQRLNLYVERLPTSHQVIINAINKAKQNG